MTARVAVITGSTSGIGAEAARRLHHDGFAVVVTGRDEERGRNVAEGLGSGAMFVAADLVSTDGPGQLMDAAIAQFGSVDVVVNNAAMDYNGELLEAPIEKVRSLFEMNSVAALAVLQEGAKRMTRGGSIINVTSRLAVIGVPGMSIYSSTKGAVLALTTAAAVELAPRNIRVNAVAPGLTATPLYDAWLSSQPDPDAALATAVQDIPLKRIATPQDVTAVISFLASTEAEYITGASIPVDGGYTAR